MSKDAIGLSYWYVTTSGNLRGDLASGKGISTSRMMSRDGNVVTTWSGSKYRLSEKAHPYIEDGNWLHSFGDRWQLIDNHIKRNIGVLTHEA